MIRICHRQVFTSDEPGDPNGDGLLEYWLGLCDYYNFPHVVQFDSWPDLLDKLRRTDLAAVSQRMSRFNAEQKLQLKDTWRTILADARARRSHVATHTPASDFDEAMRRMWGLAEPLRPDPPHTCAQYSAPSHDPAKQLESPFHLPFLLPHHILGQSRLLSIDGNLELRVRYRP